MDEVNITYNFHFPGGEVHRFPVKLDSHTLELYEPKYISLPWTALDYQQCPHCPLDDTTHKDCPMALSLSKLSDFCDSCNSHDEVLIEVRTRERMVSQTTTVQRGLSSLLGLVLAVSGCPYTHYLKPMARFHLPFASEEETIYRSVSMYVLAQFLLAKENQITDINLNGLKKAYENLQTVNSYMAKRIRQAFKRDPAINAVVLLDLLAKTLPYSIDESLQEIRHLFAFSYGVEI